MSALLNVNVDSTSGRAEVLAFKEFVQKNLSSIKWDIKVDNLPTLKMQIDEAALNASLTSILGQVHEIGINTGSITKSVEEALGRAFSTEYTVKIASAHLTEQVSAAVKAGMSLGEITGVGARTNTGSLGGGVTPSMLAEAVRSGIAPLADKIDLMTRSTENSMRQGRRTGSVSISGRADGVSVGVKASLAPDEALAFADQAQKLAAADKAEKEQEKINARALAATMAAQDAEDAYLRKSGAEQDAWEAARQKERDSAWLSYEKQQTAERVALLEQMAAEEEAIQKQANDGWLAHEKAVRAESIADQKATNAQALAETEAFYAQEEAILRAAQAKLKNAKAEAQAEADANDEAQVAALKASLAEQVAAQEAAEAKIKDSYKRLKLAASEQYKGVGPAISAGQQIQSVHGTDAAKTAMGSDSYLLGQTDQLGKLSKALDESGAAAMRAGEAHVSMTKVMDEAHSAARGLTGALGALWLTWGSLVPMVAGAAIGTGLQQVFSVGKDVEYQLTFVSALSQGAVVDLQRFGDAVRGNLIVPKEAAEGMRALAQNGLNVTDSLKALPDVLRLATVGEMSVSDAALGATGVMNAFGLSVDDLGRIGDVFAKAAAESNTSVQGMVESMKQASTVSDLYHVSLEETAATLEIMAKRNITGTQAGTAFRKMIEEIATPSATAKKSIELLGLQFYDTTTKQLKPYSEILTEIKGRTDKLNEESKLDLLNNIFGERGAKALNAVLSDFDQYNAALGTLKTQSQDFAKGIADQLSQSTEGRIKAAMTDFQLVAIEAFSSAGGAANTFVDTFRQVVDDPAFKSGLTGLANNVAALSQFLLENGKWMAELGISYTAFTSIEALVAGGMRTLATATEYKVAADATAVVSTTAATVALEAETVAAGTLSATYRGMTAAMGLATFGISAVLAVVAPLLIELILFKDHTDELTNSINNNAEALKRQQGDMDREAERLQQTNTILTERNRLMAEGMSYEDAEKQANANAGNTSAQKKRDELVGDYRQAASLATQAHVNADLSTTAEDGGAAAARAADKADEAAKKAYDNWQSFEDKLKEAQSNATLAANNSAQQSMLTLRKQVEDFNKSVADLSKTSPAIAALHAHVSIGSDESQKDIAADLKTQQDAVNAAKENLHLPDKNKKSEELAETAGLIAEIKRRETELTAYYSFRQQLEYKLFQSGINNAQIKADTDSRLEQEHLDDLQAQIEDAKKRLTAESAKYPGKDGEAERTRIKNVIDALTEQNRQLQNQVDQKRVIAQLDADYAARKDQSTFKKTLSGLSAEDQKRLGDNQGTFDKQLKGPDTAYQTGYRQVQDAYSKPIEDQTSKLEKAKEDLDEIQKLMARIKGTGDSQTDQYQQQLDDSQKKVDIETQLLQVIKQQGAAASAQGGQAAQNLYDRSQTAGFGWNKFWTQWSANAASNAKIVEDVLSTTFTGLTNEFANFVTTGKFNFRSLVADIIATAAKAVASKELSELMQIGLSLFGGSSSSSAGLGNGGAGDYSNAGLAAAFAGGGGGDAGGGQLGADSLHPVNENDPELYTYNGKQYLMAGSKGGKVTPMDRAYQGSAGGTQYSGATAGANQQNNVNMNINVASDGQSKVSNDSSGQQAGQLGRMMNAAVLNVLTEQQRPGGILYPLKGN